MVNGIQDAPFPTCCRHEVTSVPVYPMMTYSVGAREKEKALKTEHLPDTI